MSAWFFIGKAKLLQTMFTATPGEKQIFSGGAHIEEGGSDDI